jgi:hypothetical protein
MEKINIHNQKRRLALKKIMIFFSANIFDFSNASSLTSKKITHDYKYEETMRKRLKEQIDDDYKRHRLLVHNQCILSYTELELLILNFPIKLIG